MLEWFVTVPPHRLIGTRNKTTSAVLHIISNLVTNYPTIWSKKNVRQSHVVIHYLIFRENCFITTGRNPRRHVFAVLTAERFASAKKVELAEPCVHTHHLAGKMCYVVAERRIFILSLVVQGKNFPRHERRFINLPDGLLHAGSWTRSLGTHKSALWKSLDWTYRLACLATWYCRCDTPLILLTGVLDQDQSQTRQEI